MCTSDTRKLITIYRCVLYVSCKSERLKIKKKKKKKIHEKVYNQKYVKSLLKFQSP